MTTIINGHHGKYLLFKKLKSLGVIFGSVQSRTFCKVMLPSYIPDPWSQVSVINGGSFCLDNDDASNTIISRIDSVLETMTENEYRTFPFTLTLRVNNFEILFNRSGLPGRMPEGSPTEGFRSIRVSPVSSPEFPGNSYAVNNLVREVSSVNRMPSDIVFTDSELDDAYRGFSVWLNQNDFVYRGVLHLISRIHHFSVTFDKIARILAIHGQVQAEIEADRVRQQEIENERRRLQAIENERIRQAELQVKKARELARQQEIVEKIKNIMPTFEGFSAVRSNAKKKSYDNMAKFIAKLNCSAEVIDNSVEGESVTRAVLSFSDIEVSVVATETDIRIANINIESDRITEVVDILAARLGNVPSSNNSPVTVNSSTELPF
jgi:hypothetical protein